MVVLESVPNQTSQFLFSFSVYGHADVAVGAMIKIGTWSASMGQGTLLNSSWVLALVSCVGMGVPAAVVGSPCDWWCPCIVAS